MTFLAHVAQLVERVLGKDEVGGSSPLLGSYSVYWVERAGEITHEIKGQ